MPLYFNNFTPCEVDSSSYINHFSQPDTIIPDPSNPQAWNRYSYVGNNPIRFNDPTGHMRDESGCRTIGCSLSQKQKDDAAANEEYYEKQSRTRKCEAGNIDYCSYAKNHPVETTLFIIGSFAAPGLIEYTTLGGGAAAATDVALLKAGMACARSLICWKVAVALGILNYYPPNNGFASNPTTVTLQEGQIITRFGENTGKYASPIGTSFSARALPPSVDPTALRGFQVIKPIENVLSGPIQGWFGQPGGGVQFYLGVAGRTIQSLIDSGHLLELP